MAVVNISLLFHFFLCFLSNHSSSVARWLLSECSQLLPKWDLSNAWTNHFPWVLLVSYQFCDLDLFSVTDIRKSKMKVALYYYYFFSFASSDAIEFNLAYLWHASKRSCTKCFFCCCFVLKETIAEFLYLDKNVNVGYFSEAVWDLSNFAQW